jgi:hypothetical protein
MSATAINATIATDALNNLIFLNYSTGPLPAEGGKQYQKSNIKSQNDKLKCKNLPHFAL